MRRPVVVLQSLPFVLGLAACEAGGGARDASVGPSTHLRSVTVRLDVTRGDAQVTALEAFGAGLPAERILALVDPLAAPPPVAGCELRDVASEVRSATARGAAVEVDELPGVEVSFGDGQAVRPAPRLLPDLGGLSGVAGVGRTTLGALPAELTLGADGVQAVALSIAPPAAARLIAVAGRIPSEGASIDVAGGLGLTVEVVEGARRPAIEIRPYGDTVSVVCAVPPDGRVDVPRSILAPLVLHGEVVAAVDVVQRDAHAWSFGGGPCRVAVETRATVTLELRP